MRSFSTVFAEDIKQNLRADIQNELGHAEMLGERLPGSLAFGAV